MDFIDGTIINLKEVKTLNLNEQQTRDLKNIMFKVFNILNSLDDLDYTDNASHILEYMEQNNIKSIDLLKHFVSIGLDIE